MSLHVDSDALPENPRPESLYYREIEDGFEVVVYAMSFGKARLCLSETGLHGCILDAWCYATHSAAIEAGKAWDGKGDPPDGWHRNPFTGRRRVDGDPAREYQRP